MSEDPIIMALGKLAEKAGLKVFDENHSQTQAFFIRYPLLIGLIAIIPLGIGPGLGYAVILEQKNKAALFFFADWLLLFLGPGYAIYKLLLAYDQIAMAKRMGPVEELGEWEFFWTER